MMTRVLAVVAIFAATTATSQWLSRPEPDIARLPLSHLSTSLEGWTSTELPLEPNVLTTLGVDDHVSRLYQRQDQLPVSIYVGFYATQRTGQTIHSPLKCLPGTGWQPIETGVRELEITDASGQAARVSVNRYEVQKGMDRHLVFFWYQMRGHVVTSEYLAKLYLIDGALRTNRTDGALVRVIVPVPDGASDEIAEQTATSFIGLLYPNLSAHLPD